MNRYVVQKEVIGAVISKVIFGLDDISLELVDSTEPVVVSREFLAMNQPNIGDLYVIDEDKVYVVKKEEWLTRFGFVGIVQKGDKEHLTTK